MTVKRMESPLIPVILYEFGSMRRHYQSSDDYKAEQNEGLDRQQQQRPQEPDGASRVRQADPPTGPSPSSIAPTMHAAKKRRASDISSVQSYSYQRSKSFEERNEERSAFTSIPKTQDRKESSTATNQEEDKKRPSQDPDEAADTIIMQRPVASMPIPSSTTTTATSSAKPHLSPMRYYHQQRYAESIRSQSDVPAFQYPYIGGAVHPARGAVHPTQLDPYGYSYPAGYYHQHQYPRPDPPSARGHPQFPFFQDYSHQQPQYQQPSIDALSPAATAYAQQQRSLFADAYYAPPGVTPARSYSKKDPPESVATTVETKAGRVSTLDPSPTRPSPPIEADDERKPPARSSSKIPTETHDQMNDLYAPIPFSEVRSLLTSSMKTPSPPSPSPAFDPFENTPERTHARGAQLPQHSPVVSSSMKRRRDHYDDSPVKQSYSAGSTPSAASSSRRAKVSDSASKRGNSWDRRFNELLDFKQLHGHCDVPQNYEPNPSLGIWVNKQRMEHKNRIEGKSSSLNDTRLERLQSIGFRWAKRKGQASWEEKFRQLKEYKAEYGNCHVPTKFKENSALGRWVSTQRSEYKKFCEGDTKTSMNADKIRRLESIGFAWFMVL